VLLLVTVLLVVIGAISLGIGFVQSETLPIYVCIGCCIVAGALLLIFTRMTAKTQKIDSSSGGPEAVPATAGTGFLGRPSSEETFGGGSGVAVARYADDEDYDDAADDDDFPIDRYDSRRVGEILPLLAELDVDELDVVREREERGKGRATILARIDQLIEQLEAEDSDEAEHRFDAPAADELDDAAMRPASPPVRVAAMPMDDDYFPIEDYDDLRASEILPLLPELDDDELDMVRERERTGSARASILHRVDALLEVEPADAGPGPVPYEEPEPVAPVRKTRGTRAAAKARPVPSRATKAPAVRTVKATPVKATPVKATVAKAPLVKTPLVKTPLVKTPLVKTPLVKTPSKAPRVTKAAPAAAKASARKVPAARASSPGTKTVKAAAPAKAPTQKRTATPSSTPTSRVTKKAAKR